MAWIRACGGGSPAVPDGRTVTPINDVTIWQQCAGIANPTYTTLAEVLADTGILQTLMASNNAVDYLVRSKQFIGSRALVPTMTSDSTPSGECGATTTDPSDHPYYAFDGNSATAWDPYKSGSAVNGEKVWYHFPSAVRCSKAVFGLKNSTIVGRVNELEIVGSNDGSNWTVLGSKSAGFAVDNNEIACNGANEYSYLGLNIKDGTDTIYIAYLQFSFDGICQNSNAMYYIGQNNYASNTLLGDSDWCNAICNSTYFESVLNVKVPIMTSNTTPKGVVSAINYWGTDYPWKAFDGDPSTMWASDTADGVHWLGYEFTEDVCVVMMQYKTRNLESDYIAKTIDIQCNNADWETVETVTPSQTQGDTSLQTFIFANDISSAKWQAKFINAGGHYSDAYTLQFYGRKDV